MQKNQRGSVNPGTDFLLVVFLHTFPDNQNINLYDKFWGNTSTVNKRCHVS